MGDGSDPFSALLSGLQNSEAVAQQENPYPDIASGIAHLQLGPAMTIYGMPIAEQANPTKYAIEKALLGAGTGLAQGAGIGLQQQNNTDLTNAFLTGDHSNISPEMWAPMQNAMGLFGQAQKAQQGMELFKNMVDTRSALAKGIGEGTTTPQMASSALGFLMGGSGSGSASTGAIMPLPPKEAIAKGLELQHELTNGDAASNYADVSSAYKNLVDGFSDQTPTGSVTMAQKLAQMVSPRARFNAATGDVATGDQGIDQLIKNHLSEIQGDGLDLATKAQFLRAGNHLLQNQYGQYMSQTTPDVTANIASGVPTQFTQPLPGPDLVKSANTALQTGLKYKIPTAALTSSLIQAFPDLKLQQNPKTGQFRMVPDDG